MSRTGSILRDHEPCHRVSAQPAVRVWSVWTTTLAPTLLPLPVRRDRVTPELWDFVYERDEGICLAWRLGERDCRGKWGDPVRWRNGRMHRSDVTFAHVKDQPMLGRRAPSDARHGVLECWAHNVYGWSSAHRAEEKAYLEEINRER